MNFEEQIEYLRKTGLYESETDLFYVKRMLKNTDKTVPVSELVNRFIEIDKYFNGEPWNILQILANINMIIPIEDRGDEDNEIQ